MESDSRVAVSGEAGGFGPDAIERAMRERVRATIEQLIEEELAAALGAAKSERVGATRVGDRHGARPRTVTTSLGPTTFAMPRARMSGRDGEQSEWRSQAERAPRRPSHPRRDRRESRARAGTPSKRRGR
jgi:transposase-like protein